MTDYTYRDSAGVNWRLELAEGSEEGVHRIVASIPDSLQVEPGANPIVVTGVLEATTRPVEQIDKGGTTSSSSSKQLADAEGDRDVIEISNGGKFGIYLSFGSSAKAGEGSYLPAQSSKSWITRQAVNIINESGGENVTVSFTEFAYI